jgi:ribonuclease HII
MNKVCKCFHSREKNGDSYLQIGVNVYGKDTFVGPVFVSCVLWDSRIKYKLFDKPISKLKDSDIKHLKQIIEQDAITFSISKSSVYEIDKYSIDIATHETTLNALKHLMVNDEHKCLCYFINNECVNDVLKPYTYCLIKSDSMISLKIAKLLSYCYYYNWLKTYDLNGLYNWKKNGGNLSVDHIIAIKNNGISPYHRKISIQNSI